LPSQQLGSGDEGMKKKKKKKEVLHSNRRRGVKRTERERERERPSLTVE
jgi:hypothetical protein